MFQVKTTVAADEIYSSAAIVVSEEEEKYAIWFYNLDNFLV